MAEQPSDIGDRHTNRFERTRWLVDQEGAGSRRSEPASADRSSGKTSAYQGAAITMRGLPKKPDSNSSRPKAAADMRLPLAERLPDAAPI